ncbi:MAG TPA: hypothetical protein VFN02_01750 [Ktedonobacteraceae bacterium]|nr:hypothetical protein [Ktedonobacteraceae bacterium]
MADNKQLQQARETTQDVIASLHETNQAVMDNLLLLQDRNLKFVHSIFLSWMELLTQQMESIGTMREQWGQQTQRLIPASMQLYTDFFLAPLTASRKLVEASMTAPEREREPVS